MDRHIRFTAVYNFRDLGGYQTMDGRAIRWRRLFRADALQRLTAEEARWLRSEIGLRTVIDMQGHGGREPGLLVTNGVVRHHLELWDDHMRDLLLRLDPPISADFYIALAERFADRFAGALRLLARQDAYPAVFHWTIGKDRTGVLAALLLSTLGVDDETIIEDYALSAGAIDGIRDHLLTAPDLTDEQKAHLDLTLAVEPSAIQLMFDALRAAHGSVEGYLLAHGMTDAGLNQLRDALLE